MTPATPLSPVWPSDGEGEETRVWQGPGRVTGQVRERETTVVLTWEPELEVRYRQQLDEAAGGELFPDLERRYLKLSLPALGVSTTVGPDYEVDPIKDLRPICPNCHALVYRERLALSIDQLRSRLRVGR